MSDSTATPAVLDAYAPGDFAVYTSPSGFAQYPVRIVHVRNGMFEGVEQNRRQQAGDPFTDRRDEYGTVACIGNLTDLTRAYQ